MSIDLLVMLKQPGVMLVRDNRFTLSSISLSIPSFFTSSPIQHPIAQSKNSHASGVSVVGAV